MRAMVINRIVSLEEDHNPLEPAELPDPAPAEKEILVKVSVCGVCHTELDETEGRTPPPRLPVVPGHQVVGRVAGNGPGAARFNPGDRVGVAWIHSACRSECKFCESGNENLCPDFVATGRDVNGGYAELMTVHEDFAYPIPEELTDAEAAPLLCAGAIGWRSLRLAGFNAGGFSGIGGPGGRVPDLTESAGVPRLGLTGFGASGHLVLKLVRGIFPETEVFVFARSVEEREFSKELGAVWAGGIGDEPPHRLDAIIDTTPAWNPLVEALRLLKPGGRLVINAIRKEDGDKDCLLDIDYASHLWLEKEIKSVANVARRDVSEMLGLAARIELKPEVETFPLEEANRVLVELKSGRIRGAKVLQIG